LSYPERVFRHVGTVKCVSEISRGVTDRLRRAGGFALVASLALAAPVLGASMVVPFALIALGAAVAVDSGPLFELFTRPGDWEDGRLNGLAGFSLAAAALAVLSTMPRTPLPVGVFVATLLILGFENLSKELSPQKDSSTMGSAIGRMSGMVFLKQFLSTAGRMVLLPLVI
jgi:hypothetical protein